MAVGLETRDLRRIKPEMARSLISGGIGLHLAPFFVDLGASRPSCVHGEAAGEARAWGKLKTAGGDGGRGVRGCQPC